MILGIVDVLIIAVALSTDAFAVSVCKGLSVRKIKAGHLLAVGFYFGIFQALMPTIGYFLGKQFEKYITSIDHWIAFILLSIIGIQMIAESFKKDDDKEEDADKLNLKEYFMLAIATSIDALAVGISLAFLSVSLVKSVSFIGIITFAISFAGVFIGNKFGACFKSKAEFAGGAILILIALKILLGHLGVINF